MIDIVVLVGSTNAKINYLNETNMRPIKFRAWCPDYCEMLHVSQITFDENTVADHKPHIIDEHNDIHFFNEIELMQSTGKKDITGIEIYEDDIVQGICSNYPAYLCEGLRLSNSMGKKITGVVKYSTEYAQFYVTTDGITYLDFKNGIKNIEVIGNRYENPDTEFLHSIPGMVESIQNERKKPSFP
jgi:uncharacterized phage protein (TIGR01671 family)